MPSLPRAVKLGLSLDLGDWHRRALAASSPCVLCERRCGVQRLAGETGHCGLGAAASVYQTVLVTGEEAAISPSLLVMLRGCNLACSFCSESESMAVEPGFSPSVAPRLAESIARRLSGLRFRVKTLNFVGGEPSLSLPFAGELLASLDGLVDELPMPLLNTNGLLSEEGMALAAELFGAFVVDTKFGDARCAAQLAGWSDAVRIVQRNLLWLQELRPRPLILLRHLLLPGHVECCTRPLLQWLGEFLPDLPLNLMTAFARFAGTRAQPWPELLREERERGIEVLRASHVKHKLLDGQPLRARA